jgi:hypothetical protein
MAIALLLGGAQVHAALGSGPAGVETSTIAHGVRLTVHLDRAVYPWHALIRATVRVENDSHNLAIIPRGRTCPGPNPMVSIWDRRNRVVSTTGVAAIVPCVPTEGGGTPSSMPASDARGVRLRPGAAHVWSEFVVLNGPRISASATVVLASDRKVISSTDVTTRRARVRFIPASKPAVTFWCPPAICVHIAPGSGAHPSGPMYEASTAAAVGDDGVVRLSCRSISIPRPAASTTLRPTCPEATVWHIMAGWLNHRVVETTWKQVRLPG